MIPSIRNSLDLRLFFVVFFIILNPSLNFLSFPLKLGSFIGFLSLLYLRKEDFKYILILFKFISLSIIFVSIFIVRALAFDHEISLLILIYINLVFFLLIAISLSKFYSVESFFQYFVLVVFINSLIIIFEFFFPVFKNFIESLLYQDIYGNISYSSHDFRFRGLAQGGGAALGLLHLLGIIVIIHVRCFSFKGVLFVLSIYISFFFISRSSIIIGTLLILVYFISLFYYSNNKIIILSTFVIAIFSIFQIISYYFQSLDLNISWFYWAFDWAETYIETGELEFSNSSVNQLVEETKFDFNILSFFIGNGFFSGNSQWLVQSDSGYWRLFNSIGLGALVYYICFVYFSIKYLDFRFIVLILFLFTFLMFEYKEPVLIQNYSIRFFFLILLINFRKACIKI